MNKKNIILIAGFVVLAIVSFYAGTAYSVSKKSNLPAGSNQFGQSGQNGQFGQNKGMRTNGGNVFGQIIAKDATSITIQLNAPTGPNTNDTTTTATGSKIVLYTTSTTVSKTTTGTIADLVVGTNISVQGTANPDGSVSAQSVSIRSPQSNTRN